MGGQNFHQGSNFLASRNNYILPLWGEIGIVLPSPFDNLENVTFFELKWVSLKKIHTFLCPFGMPPAWVMSYCPIEVIYPKFSTTGRTPKWLLLKLSCELLIASWVTSKRSFLTPCSTYCLGNISQCAFKHPLVIILLSKIALVGYKRDAWNELEWKPFYEWLRGGCNFKKRKGAANSSRWRVE